MSYSQDIQSLIEALKTSPDNVTIRYMLAEKLLRSGYSEEAENHLQTIIQTDRGHLAAKTLLAEAFYKRKKFTAVIMIAEEMVENKYMPFDMKILYAKALVKEGNLKDAQSIYMEILEEDKEFADQELDDALKIKQLNILDEIEASDSVFLEESDVSFKDVGGLDHVKKEIDMKIIKPMSNPEIFKMYGKKIGGGILLYGPPGCGKTFIARATAGEIKAKFISVSISDILDMYIGQSERNLAEVFEIARNNKPCVIFFDEVDALGANRHSMVSSAGKTVINQFLSELDGISSDNDGLLIIGATNTPWALDTAFRRPGRFHFSGADIKAVVDIAIEEKLEEALLSGTAIPISTKDLLTAIKKHTATTTDWFNVAKNYALYANQSGLYDEVLKYLK